MKNSNFLRKLSTEKNTRMDYLNTYFDSHPTPLRMGNPHSTNS